MKQKKQKMNKKNLVVTFCTFALALLLVATVSAAEITTTYHVTVDGLTVANSGAQVSADQTSPKVFPVSVVAGEDFVLKVYFLSDVFDTDVIVEATVDGEKVSFDAQTGVFDVERGSQYSKVLVMEVPYELKDELSDELTLSIEIDGKDHKTTLPDITLKVQRPSYNVDIKSVTAPSTISAGDEFPVEIVLKNVGYNDLDDVYVSAAISELGVVQGPKWFGDLVSLECEEDDCDEEDTVIGTLYLKVPYGVKPGVYDLEVLVQNDDLRLVRTAKIVISNDYVENILVTSTSQTVRVGEEAKYSLLIVNPTDNVKVYRIVTDGSVLSASQSVVAVPAGSSATVEITGSSDKPGKFTYSVNVFDGNELVKTIPLELNVEGNASSNTIVVLTVVLAIIFLVLLVVLIVLLSRKPEKSTTEDFGESYY